MHGISEVLRRKSRAGKDREPESTGKSGDPTEEKWHLRKPSKREGLGTPEKFCRRGGTMPKALTVKGTSQFQEEQEVTVHS